jgi:hypothetical protein
MPIAPFEIRKGKATFPLRDRPAQAAHATDQSQSHERWGKGPHRHALSLATRLSTVDVNG